MPCNVKLTTTTKKPGAATHSRHLTIIFVLVFFVTHGNGRCFYNNINIFSCFCPLLLLLIHNCPCSEVDGFCSLHKSGLVKLVSVVDSHLEGKIFEHGFDGWLVDTHFASFQHGSLLAAPRHKNKLCSRRAVVHHKCDLYVCAKKKNKKNQPKC